MAALAWLRVLESQSHSLAEASQPIFNIKYREILAFRVKNRESEKSRIFLS